MRHTILSVGAIAAAGLTAGAPAQDAVLRVGELHVGDARVITGAVVIVKDGRIAAVGRDLEIPAGAEVISIPSGVMTPGLIDANALVSSGSEPVEAAAPRRRSPSALALFFDTVEAGHDHADEDGCSAACSGWGRHCLLDDAHEGITPGQACPVCGFPEFGEAARDALVSGVAPSLTETEASSEIVPHTRVIDGVNLRSPDFKRLLAGGVTTVFVSPDSSAVIGPRGAIVRTGGAMSGRIVEAESAVQATMGSDAYRVGAGNAPPFRGFVGVRTRRPNTRMGVVWVFRKAFYDAGKMRDGLEMTGADAPPTAAAPVLGEILDGAVGLRMQARTQSDITTAVRLAREFGLKFTLLEGTEAYACVDEVKSAGARVVFGPIYSDAPGVRAFTREVSKSRLSAFKELLDAGITTALSAQDLRDEDGLARQAMYAVRTGVSEGEALRAVTLTAAEVLGIEEDAGSVEVGKRADLVVWSGAPLAAASKPVLVMIGGDVVLDGRAERTAMAK